MKKKKKKKEEEKKKKAQKNVKVCVSMKVWEEKKY